VLSAVALNREGNESVRPWELVVHDRKQRRQVSLAGNGSLLIGRSAECDVRLDDESVSRHHARLHLASMELEDLSSRNGCWWLAAKPGVRWETLAERIAAEGSKLEPGARQRFGEGCLLKLGNVIGYLQRSTPVVHTIPAPPAPQKSGSLVLEDSEMMRLYELATRAAGTNLPVLVLGETGVGKDVLAGHIHRASGRRDGPLVRVNCGALSESLLESELFGHQRGAFTGAADAKPGLLELGHGGTVFLDEIGELPLSTQVKLLHVLETSEVTRVGATRSQRIDVRFVAATNRELAREVQLGRFRKDLYFRINAVCLKIAPLRSRRADIRPLVQHFLTRFCAAVGIAEPELTPEVLQHLEQYGWPGNVRELKNAVERAPILCNGGQLLPQHFTLESELLSDSSPSDSEARFSDDEAPTRVGPIERGPVVRSEPSLKLPPSAGLPYEHIEAALRNCGGNQTRAASLLGISRRTLVNRLNQYNLPRPRKANG
jgi:two-component system response regulator AtoC